MYREPLQEDLLEELTRLVGRPVAVVHDAVARLLDTVVVGFDAALLRSLGPFPMTAWPSLAPDSPETRRLWSAVLGTGLTAEEVFTALAVVDDHVRRRFGNDAWFRVHDWCGVLAGQCRAAAANEPPRKPMRAV